MVLVAGATGSLGGRIVRNLLASGERVRALVRPTTDSSALLAAGVEVVPGDLKDTTSLGRACDQVEVVVSTATASRRGDDTIENVDLAGSHNLVEAARSAGVRRFVYVSTMGASPDNPNPLFRAKGLIEQLLRDSGMEYTILQPDAFMDVWFGMLVEMPIASGWPVTLVGDSRRRHSFVAENDVAAFAAAAVRHPDARNQTIVIGGPEAVTFRHVVGAYENATSRKIAVRSVAPGEPIPGLPEVVWGIAAALESYDSPVEMNETAKRYGVRLIGVDDFARNSSVAKGAEEANRPK
jgi:uncharacterized protein YbjT (DUF2867 family)